MAVYLAPGWEVDLEVTKGWLCVALMGPESPYADANGIAESLALLLEQEATDQMLVELDDLEGLPDELADELVELVQQAAVRREVVRLCGVPEVLIGALPPQAPFRGLTLYKDRESAQVGFFRPGKPR